ncbi:MAG: DUF4962 domain-containing protein [Thermoguttaceae bacterium]
MMTTLAIRIIRLLAACLLVATSGWSGNALATAAELPLVDFEQGPELAHYGQRLAWRSLDASVVPAGADREGHCLRLRNTEPSTSCALDIRGPLALARNLTLSFDYRVEIEPGHEGAYLGMSFFVDGRQWFWQSDEFSDQWRRVEVHLGSLPAWQDHAVRPGLVFSSIQLYGRVKDKTPVRGETLARMTVYFDNIVIDVSAPRSVLVDGVRPSTANPPLFQWRRSAPCLQRLQYSMDPAFEDSSTVSVDARWNFFTPAEFLKPGVWYWRVWSSGELTEGWSDIERIEVLPDAHRFTTGPVPLESLAAAARPRLLPLARLAEPGLDDARKAQLGKNAEKIYRQGVPDHPGVHVPGDPRWPTWIDWYGKVAGGITGGTGRRLERIGSYAMLTGDPQVIGWAKELALQACGWDPEGGSAMREGDIGAHHLLRGLNWCYDACRNSMSPDEERRLREIIVRRAEQFHERLNPFRGSEANNHAWLQAFGLAESGIVLAGEHEAAAQWAEVVRQLYLGRFLCCLGRQGDNNEGISYWGYGLGFVVGYADLMNTVCGIDLYRHPWLRETARFPMYCAPPGAWAVSFADTGKPNHSVRGPAETGWVRQLALRTRDPYALWYCGAREPVDGLEPKPPADLPQSIHYESIGWAIFNTSLVDGRQGATAALHAGRYFAGHQHPDQNSFVVNAWGEKLAIDGGYYDWYGSPHFKAYSMTTLAHNTLLVDGSGQAACTAGADGRIATWVDSPGYGYTVGDASDPEIYGGKLTRFDRRLIFIKPGFVIIHDLVDSTAAAPRYDWMLHAVTPIETDDANSSFTISCPNASLRGRFLAPASVGLKVTSGFPVEPVDGYSTRPVPPDKYVPEWHLYATPQQPVPREEFLAVMQIQRLDEEPDAEAVIEPVEVTGAHGIRIRVGDRTHLVLSRKGNAEGLLRCNSVETDGQVAAVELSADGTVGRALAVGATKLRCNGRQLLDAPAPRNWATPGP